MKCKANAHPIRSFLLASVIVTTIAPFAGLAGTFTPIIWDSQTRIAACVQSESRNICEQRNRWDSVSFANLFGAIWRGYLFAAPVLGIVAGVIAFRAAQPRIVRQLPPALQNRLSGAIDNGLDLEELLNQAGYQK